MPEVYTLKEQGSQNTEQPQLHVWSRSEADAKEDVLPGRARSCFSFCLTVLSSAGLMARSVNVKITKASLTGLTTCDLEIVRGKFYRSFMIVNLWFLIWFCYKEQSRSYYTYYVILTFWRWQNTTGAWQYSDSISSKEEEWKGYIHQIWKIEKTRNSNYMIIQGWSPSSIKYSLEMKILLTKYKRVWWVLAVFVKISSHGTQKNGG